MLLAQDSSKAGRQNKSQVHPRQLGAPSPGQPLQTSATPKLLGLMPAALVQATPAMTAAVGTLEALGLMCVLHALLRREDALGEHPSHGATTQPCSSPQAVAHLLHDHHPDVVALQALHEVGALADDVWDGHHPKQGDQGYDGHKVGQHQEAAPQLGPVGQGTQQQAVLSRAHEAVADEGADEGAHRNLQGQAEQAAEGALNQWSPQEQQSPPGLAANAGVPDNATAVWSSRSESRCFAAQHSRLSGEG